MITRSSLPTVLVLEGNGSKAYDLFIAAIGYEERARYVAESLHINADERLAIGFISGHVFNYDKNTRWYRDAGFSISHVEDSAFDAQIARSLRGIATSKTSTDPIRVCVDISSLSRLRMALLIRRFVSERLQRDVEVDFLYTLAAFSPPPSIASANTHVGPVLPSFSGWWTAPERPLAAAVGLGYEQNKALGAVEHVQASSIWTFTPVSPIAEYSPELEQANSTLLGARPRIAF
jgi:hypothetical protein